MRSGKTHPFYSIAFTGDRQLRIELYVDGSNEQAQQHLWEQLVSIREQIDATLPGLDWDAIPNKRASRISLHAPFDDASGDNEDQWDTCRDWIVTNLGAFRDAFQPHIDIDQLTPYVPPVPAGDPGE